MFCITDGVNCLNLIKVMDIDPQQVVMADDSKVIHWFLRLKLKCVVAIKESETHTKAWTQYFLAS